MKVVLLHIVIVIWNTLQLVMEDHHIAVSGLDMADHMVDLYYYFKSSTRRKEILLEFLRFLNME